MTPKPRALGLIEPQKAIQSKGREKKQTGIAIGAEEAKRACAIMAVDPRDLPAEMEREEAEPHKAGPPGPGQIERAGEEQRSVRA